MGLWFEFRSQWVGGAVPDAGSRVWPPAVQGKAQWAARPIRSDARLQRVPRGDAAGGVGYFDIARPRAHRGVECIFWPKTAQRSR